MKGQRRLALGVLLGAAGLAMAAVPVRATWWGGWILAIAEAGIVGGLADWFAVTAIFRRPLGLPIPHTGLIPRNWELMAERVGVMVGGRVLTKEYVRDEIARVDLADLIARGAERLTRGDLERAIEGGMILLDARQQPPQVRLDGGDRLSRDGAELQRQLMMAGYYRGRIDGRYGRQTALALREFQFASRLPPTGHLDMSALDTLGLSKANMAYLQPPSRSREVWVPITKFKHGKWKVKWKKSHRPDRDEYAGDDRRDERDADSWEADDRND